MNTGQGIGVQSLFIAAALAPTAAFNGLRIDNGSVVLGDFGSTFGSNARLVNDRTIDLNSNYLEIGNITQNPRFIIDGLNGLAVLQAGNGSVSGKLVINVVPAQVELYTDNTGVQFDSTTAIALMGDYNAGFTGTALKIDETLERVQVVNTTTGDRFLNLDISASGNIFQMGDLDLRLNGTKLEINDGSALAEFSTGNLRMLSLDSIAGHYQIGDLDGIGSGTSIDINDSAAEINLTGAVLKMNGTPGFTGTVNPVTSITVSNGIVTNAA